jgi:hypothetical protein
MNNNNYIGSSLFVIDLDSHGKHPDQISEFERMLKKMKAKEHTSPTRKNSLNETSYNHQRPISFNRHNHTLPPIK